MGYIFGLGIIDENMYVQIDPNTGLLVYIDVNKAQIVKTLPLGFNRFKEYANVEIYKGKLIFAPWWGESMDILIVENESVRTLLLNDSLVFSKKGYFINSIKVGERIFFIPFQYGALLEYRLDEDKLLYHEKCISNTIKNNAECYFRNAAIWRDKLVLPFFFDDRIVIFDINTSECECFDIENGHKGFVNIVIDGDMAYLLSRNYGDLFMYDLNSKELVNRIVLVKENRDCFQNMIDCDGYIFIIQRWANLSYAVDKKDLRIKEISLNNGEDEFDCDIITAKKINEEKILLFLRKEISKKIGIFDINTKKTEWRTIDYIDRLDKFYRCFYKKINLENNDFMLDDYLRCMVDKSFYFDK